MKYNYNVAMSLLFNLFTGVAFGITQIVAAPVFIYLLTDKSNTRVGLAEALQGLCEALIAIPVGLLLDLKSVKRESMLRLGVCPTDLPIRRFWACVPDVHRMSSTFHSVRDYGLLSGSKARPRSSNPRQSQLLHRRGR